MASGAITDSQITASSTYGHGFATKYARLNALATWCSSQIDANQYIQVCEFTLYLSNVFVTFHKICFWSILNEWITEWFLSVWFWLLVYEHLVSIQDSKKYSSLIKNAAINWLLHHIHDLKGYWWAFTLIGLGLV